jgi:hypothetical protein
LRHFPPVSGGSEPFFKIPRGKLNLSAVWDKPLTVLQSKIIALIKTLKQKLFYGIGRSLKNNRNYIEKITVTERVYFLSAL